jgi:NADPH2:quinone reductase
MKAMVIARFGGPEMFEAREMPEPEPGPGEVLVRVQAAAINPIDTKLREDGTVGRSRRVSAGAHT